MKWVIAGLLCIFSLSVWASGEHNKWLNKTEVPVIHIPQVLGIQIESVESDIDEYARRYHVKRCFYRIDKYKRRLKKKPDSRYYKKRMKVWVERCDGIYPRESIPMAYRLPLPEEKKEKPKEEADATK